MGADIHGVVERRWNGKWVGFRTLDNIHTGQPAGPGRLSRFQQPAALERNYVRFAALAGVRGDGPEPRGLPDDVSDTAKMLFEIEGDHSPSWLPITDACKIFLETEKYSLEQFDRDYPAYFYFGIQEQDGPLDEFRLVFWFDS